MRRGNPRRAERPSVLFLRGVKKEKPPPRGGAEAVGGFSAVHPLERDVIIAEVLRTVVLSGRCCCRLLVLLRGAEELELADEHVGS